MQFVDRKLFIILLVALLFVYTTLVFPDLAREVLNILGSQVGSS